MFRQFLKRLRYRRHSGYRYRIKEDSNQTTFVGYLEQSVFGKNNLGKYRVMEQRRRRLWVWIAAGILGLSLLWWGFEGIHLLIHG